MAPTTEGEERIAMLVYRHASCVRWLERGLLIEGQSGAGKSDLVARLLGEGARLVADDLVRIERRGGILVARPERLPGYVELRNAGIYVVAVEQRTRLDCIVRLTERTDGERLPATTPGTLLDVPLPVVEVDPTFPSAVARLRVAILATRFRAAP